VKAPLMQLWYHLTVDLSSYYTTPRLRRARRRVCA